MAWWKRDRRYVTMIKALLLALLPLVCCVVYCASQGKTIGQVYLPGSEWNDELFYYKQVEGIVKYGYPYGYFGFNESHALKLSFAAWSPVLVWPWILWGLVFGWNLMSPVLCNIFLMMLCCFLFVWLVKPTWRQLGILTLLFSLYTPFVRYMLSVMPEVICFSMLITFYSLAVNYLNKEKAYKLVLLFVLAGVMTLMRPYMLLFLLLPACFWVKRKGWKGLAGSCLVMVLVLGMYAGIKHYLGAEYFAPLFFTDWVEAFFERGVFGGIRFTLGKLIRMGRDFAGHTVQGFRTGLASGAYFAGYLVMLCVLCVQSLRDWFRWRRERIRVPGKKNKKTGNKIDGREEADNKETGSGEAGNKMARGEEAGSRNRESAGEVAGRAAGAGDKIRSLGKRLVIEVHLAFSFLAMFFAILLMYKLTEGSKHLLTFMAAGIFLVALMETVAFKKAVLVGVTFAYFYTYMAVDPYDYQVPFVEPEQQEQVQAWQEVYGEVLSLTLEEKPGYSNVVIWVFSDRKGQETESTNIPWQLLYGLPEGMGISCCMSDYLLQNFTELRSRYLFTLSGGEMDRMCGEAGYEELWRDQDAVLYGRY